MKDFSHISDGEKLPADLNQAVQNTAALTRNRLKKIAELQLELDPDLPLVKCHLAEVSQVLLNLVVNSADAIEEKLAGDQSKKGRVKILTRSEGDQVILEVQDSGAGVPEEYLDRIFEPFFTTKEVGKGTGLGLSTVYGIVKQSGGFIFAESEVGRGTSFIIYLPVYSAPAAAPAVKTPAEKKSDIWGTGTILLVEDEDMVRSVAERALSRQGYTVLTATDGEEALEVLGRGEAIDLMISDVVMPNMDGPTMVRQARKSFPELPVLFMSGYAEEQLRKSIDIDNVSFLPKPFSVTQLAEAARDALGKK
jgi:two-component system cell cycle sensor histidine kinase/response regulator CckA